VKIRTTAYLHAVPTITTPQETLAAADGIKHSGKGKLM
jgi:hypothetical protein